MTFTWRVLAHMLCHSFLPCFTSRIRMLCAIIGFAEASTTENSEIEMSPSFIYCVGSLSRRGTHT